MLNKCFEISTSDSWFPNDDPNFTLPKSPLDYLENQGSVGLFALVKVHCQVPEARTALMKALRNRGDWLDIQVSHGVVQHFALADANDPCLSYELWEMDQCNGIGKEHLESFVRSHTFGGSGGDCDIFQYKTHLVKNLPQAIFAKNGTNLSYTDSYALLMNHAADSRSAIKTFTLSPFGELLERAATDMGVSRYFSLFNITNKKNQLIVEGSEAACNKLMGLLDQATWLTDDPSKPISGPVSLKKLKCMQHTRWSYTPNDAADICIVNHPVRVRMFTKQKISSSVGKRILG